MFRIRNIIFVFIIGLSSIQSAAQNNVSELIQRALDSSHLLNVQDYLIRDARIKNTSGYAGNLPNINFNSEGRYDLNSTRLQFFDGDTRNATGASNYSASANVDLTYPIYEAGAKSLRKNQLGQELESQLINSKLEKQDIVLNVLQAIADYKFYKQQIKTHQKDTALWLELLRLREQMISIGKGTRVDLIQIQSQINQSSVQLEQVRQLKEMAKVRLQKWTFLNKEEQLPALNLHSYLKKADIIDQNASQPIQEQAKNEMRQAEIALGIARSMQYPVLSVFAGYGYAWSRNAVGILLSNQNFGPYAGLRINWNLYNGKQVQTDIESSKLQLAAENESLKAIERELNYEINELQTALNRQQIILQREKEQFVLQQEQVEIIKEQYEQGRIDILQVLNFQRQAVITQLNIANAEYQSLNYLIQILYTEGAFAN
jgi:outer membrane protein TolC